MNLYPNIRYILQRIVELEGLADRVSFEKCRITEDFTSGMGASFSIQDAKVSISEKLVAGDDIAGCLVNSTTLLRFVLVLDHFGDGDLEIFTNEGEDYPHDLGTISLFHISP